jgi:phospho-N-acetylmuramoyl-pentapeptide-transferase
MLYYLHFLANQFVWAGPLNVFQYSTFRALGAAMTALFFCLWFGPMTIRLLTRLKLGQPLRGRDEVHQLADLHSSKKGTPTMGGLLILAAVTLSCLLWARPTNLYVWLALGSLLWLGAVGFADDYLKVTKKKSAGLPGRLKLLAQFILAVVVTLILTLNQETSLTARELAAPFFKDPLIRDMQGGVLIFFALVIMGSSNAVNLTDGLDGLAIGCTITVALTYAVFCYVAGNIEMANYLKFPYIRHASELIIFCAALLGAGLGFLWYNCHPAQLFMGDTGSLAIGGALGVVAICVSQEILLVVAGGVFVMEAGSVLLQVASFKLTGKRIFAMSPLHHHFELRGWNESTVTIRFWIMSLGFALLALSSLKIR